MRRVEWVAVAVALLLAAGCATVPTTGPVEHHQPEQAGSSNGVQVAPLPPADGATQLLVVEGFLHAMSANDGNYQVARQYLTADAATRWHPDAGVQVYADGYPPTETDQSVVLTAPLTGSIDSSGIYHTIAGQLRLDFGLVKDDNGQWRISNPPNGLVVSRYLFTNSFQAVTLSFLAATGDVLLPDPRYFPTGSSIFQSAAAAVLRGPSSWLTPLTVSAPGPSVKLASVTVDDTGVAHVVLGGDAGSLSRERKDALLAELVFTLCGMDQISSVQVSVGPDVWSDKVGRWELNRSNFSSLDPADTSTARPVFLVRDGKLQRQAVQASWSDFVDVQAELPKVRDLAVSRSAEEWAATSETRTRLLLGAVGEKGTKVLRTSSGLLRPAFSRTGEIWSPTASTRGWVVYREGASIPVSLRGVPQGTVVSAALAPDGERLAVVIAQGTHTSVGLLQVRRSGARIVLDAWQPVDLALAGTGPNTLVDVGWNSVTALALLRVDSDQQTSVLVVTQDGAEQTDTGPTDSRSLRSLAAVTGRPPLALSAANDVYRFDGEFDWLLTISGVDAVAYPG